MISELEKHQAPHAVPPTDGTAHWTMLVEAEFDALVARATNHTVNPATLSLSKLLGAYAGGDAATFNQQLSEYRRVIGDYEHSLAANMKQLKEAGVSKSEILSQPKIDFEVFFNQFSPFYYAAVLYLVAFTLGVISWVGWGEPLRRASMWLLTFTLVLHTFALVARVYISGRPPITNLYSTAIFIGWAGVGLALLFEKIYRLGLGNIAASVIGFLTLLVAYNLSLDGDTFIVLQAVLDTQFWLATHVVTVNLGYSATYLTGLWGILYILLGHVFPVLDAEGRRKLLRVLYGTLCFAIFFSFVGTVLGGLVGRRFLGPLLGLGPERKRRPDDRALERAGAPRTLGRPGEGQGTRKPGRRRQYRDHLVLLRRQRAGRRPALLRRVRKQHRDVAADVRRVADRDRRTRTDARAMVRSIRGGVRDRIA